MLPLHTRVCWRKMWWMSWVAESHKITIKGEKNSQEPFSLAFHLIFSYNSAGWHEPKWTALAQSHDLEKSLIVGGMLKTLWAWFHVLSDHCSDGWRDRSPKAGCTSLNQCCVVLMHKTLIYSIDIRPCNDLMAVNTSNESLYHSFPNQCGNLFPS